MMRLRDSTGEAPESTAPSPRRRPTGPAVLAIAGVALLAVLIGLVLAFTGDDGTDSAADAADTTTSLATTSAPASPTSDAAQPAPTSNPDDLPPALPAVALDSVADAGNGITATLPLIESIQGSGTGPGNVAGPALRVTVRVHNDTADPLSLDGVAVNMAYGADKTPASPLDDPSQAPFSGAIGPGETADGVYVFSVPADARDAITVDLSYQAGAPRLLFTGPVG